MLHFIDNNAAKPTGEDTGHSSDDVELVVKESKITSRPGNFYIF